MHQMYCIHTMPEEFRNTTITTHFGFFLNEEKSLRKTEKLHDCHDVTISFFPAYQKENANFSNSSGLWIIFKKLHSRDRLVWTEIIQLCMRFPVQHVCCMSKKVQLLNTCCAGRSLKTGYIAIQWITKKITLSAEQ